MKNLVIIIGTIVLGVMIFNMMVGNGNSVKEVSKDVMVNSIENFQ